jgi:hypothetical protein
MSLSNSPEQGVHRRTDAVLLGRDRQAHDPVFSDKVTVGRRDIDPAIEQPLTIDRVMGRHRSTAVEDARQHARSPGRDVQYYEDGSGKVGGEAPDDGRQRLHAAR